MSEARRRIIVKKPGGYNAFRFDETPLEAPGPAEVQIDVRACGINFADISVRLGLYAAAKGAYPLCPGLEFAGIVRRTGSSVSEYSVGDKVFGVSRFGAYTSAINCLAEHIWLSISGMVVVFDSWYFAVELCKTIDRNRMIWITQSKSNRVFFLADENGCMRLLCMIPDAIQKYSC